MPSACNFNVIHGKRCSWIVFGFCHSLQMKQFQQGSHMLLWDVGTTVLFFGVFGYHWNILASNLEDLMLSVCHPLLLFKILLICHKNKTQVTANVGNHC